MQASATEFPKIAADTLPKCLRRGVQRWGDKVYMRRKDLGIWQRYTWNEVYDRVRAFCLGLISLGLQPGETVGIIGENTPELFWTDFATLAAGAVCDAVTRVVAGEVFCFPAAWSPVAEKRPLVALKSRGSVRQSPPDSPNKCLVK